MDPKPKRVELGALVLCSAAKAAKLVQHKKQ
jgi:hypothetical protein